ELTVNHLFVRFELIAISNRVFARERSACANVLKAFQIRLAAIDAGDARTEHREQPELTGTVSGVRKKRANLIHLRTLHIHQEHVWAVGGRLHGKFLQKIRLQGADADDEERAEADREQDHPRLVSGT